MAQAPRCKVCGEVHWSNQPHVWRVAMSLADDPGSFAPSVPADVVRAVAEATQPAHVARFDPITGERRAAPKRDRAAYMRDYRAREKPS